MRQLIEPLMPYELVRSLLPFKFSEPDFVGVCSKVFRPEGLAVWGAEGAAVEYVLSGCDVDGVCALGAVPAIFYAMPKGWGYADLVGSIEKGETPPKSWQEFQTLAPHVYLRIQVTRSGRALGPADGVQLAMWGHSIR